MRWCSRPRTEAELNKAALSAWTYSLLGRLALPAVMARLWWRGRAEPAYRQGWRQRLGFWPNEPVSTRSPVIWLHAVSLGETRAAEPLVAALRERLPALQWVLTSGTATGWEAAQSLKRPGDRQGWVPLDTPGATRRFFEATQPDLGVLMETETWPNLLAAAQAAGVPVVLANARLSERSLRKGQRWPALTQPMMQRLALVLAQSDADARRLQAAGVRSEALTVCGHLKYDLTPSADLLDQGRRWRLLWSAGGRRIVMAASWREGEDEPLLDAWTRAVRDRASAQRPLLLLVPRHPQRFEDVAQAVRRKGLILIRRSDGLVQGGATGISAPPLDSDADVILGDSLGEMAAYYACADVALLGGSFAPLGGQNLIEAAACGCPIVLGPHTFNFSDAAHWATEAGAAHRAMDIEQAVRWALSTPPAELGRMGQAGHGFAARHRGATARIADLVAELVKEPRNRPGGRSSRAC